MSAKTWTTKCPTIPGWYWVKRKSDSPYRGTETQCAEFFIYRGVMVVASSFGSHMALLDYATAWAGPIPMPKEAAS